MNLRTLSTLAGLGLSLLASPAWAHAHLTAATPPVDGTVTAAPKALSLTFTEGVNPKFTAVTLSGPDKALLATGELTADPANEAVVTVPVASPLKPGPYRVEWHALAKDGHKSSGSYGFTVAP